MNIQLIENTELKDKRVLLRLDFDHLFEKNYLNGEAPDFKIAAPTIQYLLKAKARVIIAPSFSVSKKKKQPEYTTEPYARYICDLYKCNVYMTEYVAGAIPEKLSQDMEPGSIMFLENLYGEDGELKADAEFAEQLSKLADIYVNEAFSLSGAELASNTVLLDYLEPENILYGFNFALEYENVLKINTLESPFALFLNDNGDLSGLLSAAESLIDRIDRLFLLGELSNIYSVIKNKIDNHNYSRIHIEQLKKIINSAEVRGIQVLHILDYYQHNEGSGSTLVRHEIVNNKGSYIDIGDETGKIFSESLAESKLILWLGNFITDVECHSAFGSANIIEKVKKNDIYVVGVGTGYNCDGGKSHIEDGFFKFQSCCCNTFVNSVTECNLPVLEKLEAKFR